MKFQPLVVPDENVPVLQCQSGMFCLHVPVRDSRIFTMLEKICIELGEQRRLLNLVIKKLPDDDQLTCQALPVDIKFPLKTMEELDSLEEKLQDSAVYKSVVWHHI